MQVALSAVGEDLAEGAKRGSVDGEAQGQASEGGLELVGVAQGVLLLCGLEFGHFGVDGIAAELVELAAEKLVARLKWEEIKQIERAFGR